MTTTQPDPIPPAIARLNEASRNPTGGQWLETLTADIAPHIREWDIARCWRWPDWPQRDTHFPGTTQQDIGIDAVAIRRSDGQHIAIQCKARQLDEHGRGDDIHKAEIDKFAAAVSDQPLWSELWVVTNGDNRISGNTKQALSMRDPARPIKRADVIVVLFLSCRIRHG